MKNIQPAIVRSKVRLGFKSLIVNKFGVVYEQVNRKRERQVRKFLQHMKTVWDYDLQDTRKQVYNGGLKKVRVRTQCPRCDYLRFLRLEEPVQLWDINVFYRVCKFGCGRVAISFED